MNRPTRPALHTGIRFGARPLLPLRAARGTGRVHGDVLKISIVNRSQLMRDRFHRIFAEKEIFFRSHGRVRFLRISSRVQILAAAVLAAILAGWLIGAAIMLYNQLTIAHDRAAIDAREATVADQARKVDAFRRSVRDIGADIDRRQDLLDDMVRSQFGVSGDDPAVVGAPDANTVRDDADGAAKKLSGAAPGVSALRAAKLRQTRFAQRLAALVNQRAAKAEAAIRSFGLNPAQIATRNRAAQGGPFIPWARDDMARDDSFADLARALARLNALEQGLVSIPSGRPTNSPMLSSSYGYRRDPFNGMTAFHAGLDFPGSYGQPILAAASGRIAYVGGRQGYGTVVEIDHGHGIMTRYAHLSGIAVRPGQDVTRGVTVGRMGSTGRSTGTHLHFEVRVNGAPINPRRFLEVKEDVLKVQQIAKQRVTRVRTEAAEKRRDG